MYQLMAIKVFMCVPARSSPNINETFSRRINSAQQRADVLAAVACMPLPAELSSGRAGDFYSFLDAQGDVATGESLDGVRIHESWFGVESPLCILAWQYAWASGLNVLAFTNVDREQQTVEFRDLEAIESIILASMRVLMAGMIG